MQVQPLEHDFILWLCNTVVFSLRISFTSDIFNITIQQLSLYSWWQNNIIYKSSVRYGRYLTRNALEHLIAIAPQGASNNGIQLNVISTYVRLSWIKFINSTYIVKHLLIFNWMVLRIKTVIRLMSPQYTRAYEHTVMEARFQKAVSADCEGAQEPQAGHFS